MVDSNNIKIRDFYVSDTNLIVTLNHQSVTVLSAMNEQRFLILCGSKVMCCGLPS
jgi:hypothetical protein